MNPVERFFRRLDAFQQRHPLPSFVFGIVKKYGDDNAGALVSALSHSAFGSLFPLLLFMVTVLGIVLGTHSSLRNDIVHSTVAQFPIVGSHLQKTISALHRNSAIGLGVGLGGAVWGSIGLAENGIFTMMQVWNLPGPQRPNLVKRMARGVGFLSLLGFGLLVTTFFANVVPQLGTGIWTTVGAAIVSGLVNCGEYLAAFRILTPGSVRLRQLGVFRHECGSCAENTCSDHRLLPRHQDQGSGQASRWAAGSFPLFLATSSASARQGPGAHTWPPSAAPALTGLFSCQAECAQLPTSVLGVKHLP